MRGRKELELEKGPKSAAKARNEESQAISSEGTEVSTLMLHGVPSRRALQQLLDLFQDMGFLHAIDFVYLPQRPPKCNRQRVHTMGYAFINFTSTEVMREFQEVIHHHPLGRVGQEKCEAVYATEATVQGLTRNVAALQEHFLTRPIEDVAWLRNP